MNIYETVTRFYQEYDGEKCVVGRSTQNRAIYAFFVGSHQGKRCLCQYAMHAREWVTALLALEHIRIGVPCGGVWILPLINPDGTLLCQEGLKSVSSQSRREMLGRITDDLTQWKANADAVDLNVNFDARWGTGKSNVSRPSSANFIGVRPFCAPENAALKNFTYRVRPDATISWHSKGEEIYYRFHQPPLRLLRDYRLARVLQKSTGYRLKNTPDSAGGYKDWCVEKLKIPAFTVEVGEDVWTHPLDERALPSIAAACGTAVAEFMKKL